jgi:hypothetical protein
LIKTYIKILIPIDIRILKIKKWEEKLRREKDKQG